MNEQMASAREWLDSAISASEEIATVALGLEGVELVGIRKEPPDEQGSAHIALVGEQNSVQIGIASNINGCQELARTLLGMEPDEEDLAEDEVADAMGEIANILAGQVKTMMAERNITVNLGIPIFINGHVEVTTEKDVAAADIQLGAIPATIIVLTNREDN